MQTNFNIMLFPTVIFTKNIRANATVNILFKKRRFDQLLKSLSILFKLSIFLNKTFTTALTLLFLVKMFNKINFYAPLVICCYIFFSLSQLVER